MYLRTKDIASALATTVRNWAGPAPAVNGVTVSAVAEHPETEGNYVWSDETSRWEQVSGIHYIDIFEGGGLLMWAIFSPDFAAGPLVNSDGVVDGIDERYEFPWLDGWFGATVTMTAAAANAIEHVGVYDSPDLIPAINDLLVFTAASVCLIIPARERYTGENTPGRVSLRQRYSELTVILAIRDADFVPASSANAKTVNEISQVIDLKDDFIEMLAANPGVGLAGVSLFPTDGGPQDIRDEENPDRRLWRAWVARFETPAGVAEYDNETLVY